MKDGFKRLLIVLLLVLLSTGSAYLVDRTLDKIDRDNYPLDDDINVQNAVASYSEQYAIPEEVIYTVMKMRSGCDRYYNSDGRIGLMALTVKECEAVPKSKKLLRFVLDDGTGTDRIILSGIHAYYEPEELVGKTCVAITNLPPRKMMGIDSCGMLLSAVHSVNGEERLNLLMLDNRIPAGAKLY